MPPPISLPHAIHVVSANDIELKDMIYYPWLPIFHSRILNYLLNIFVRRFGFKRGEIPFELSMTNTQNQTHQNNFWHDRASSGPAKRVRWTFLIFEFRKLRAMALFGSISFYHWEKGVLPDSNSFIILSCVAVMCMRSRAFQFTGTT